MLTLTDPQLFVFQISYSKNILAKFIKLTLIYIFVYGSIVYHSLFLSKCFHEIMMPMSTRITNNCNN